MHVGRVSPPRTVDAFDFTANLNPVLAGQVLAMAVLARGEDLASLAIDLRRCPAAQTTSGFFSAFLQQVFELEEELLGAARRVTWVAAYAHQRANIEGWITEFTPRALTEAEKAERKAEGERIRRKARHSWDDWDDAEIERELQSVRLLAPPEDA